mmetsp:Transcript_16502/g.22619  ORF Transcript_16502/g.22619 Transcript_16502/m.22619 type:complete len:139 (-) Transcript_16502:201-617(-)
MHWSTGLFGQRHRAHHQRGEGQGMLWEFRDYVLGMLAFDVIFYLLLPSSVFLPFAIGVLIFELFSAYAHQLQHDNPCRCDWMKQPVHYVHHKGHMWYHNFGMAVDWWDHVFGTFKEYDWCTEKEIKSAHQSRFAIRWW